MRNGCGLYRSKRQFPYLQNNFEPHNCWASKSLSKFTQNKFNLKFQNDETRKNELKK